MSSAPPTAGRSPGAGLPSSVPAGATRFHGYARGRPATPAPAQEKPPSAPPTPVSKRPKGRLFLGAVLFAGMLWPAVEVWNAFFRYRGRGVVEGRVLQLSPPFDGEIASVLVREGEWVEQGDVLATVRSLELEHERARLDDALRVERAALEAELGELQLASALRAEEREDRLHKAAADHLAAVGELLREKSALDALVRQRERREGLLAQGLVSDETFGELALAEHGQRAKLEQLELAVEELRLRAEVGAPEESAAARTLRPHLLRLAALREERKQLDERLAQGDIRAPAGGRVLERACFVGERATKGRTLLSVLENDSLHVVLYLDQEESRALEVGDRIPLRVDPRDELVSCTVERKGAELEPAPKSLQRHYTSDARLLPVTLRFDPEVRRAGFLRVGEVATWPLEWRWPFGDERAETVDAPAVATTKGRDGRPTR
ncbi:MAG: HlyD family efflux transporter periplasmic adaptor subunit [Planctomycetes bacterium]|nr:HlyD family efflux transporter periplasmic adaptor subunit [Planctomycetota bacterium]